MVSPDPVLAQDEVIDQALHHRHIAPGVLSRGPKLRRGQGTSGGSQASRRSPPARSHRRRCQEKGSHPTSVFPLVGMCPNTLPLSSRETKSCRTGDRTRSQARAQLSLIHISEPTRLLSI